MAWSQEIYWNSTEMMKFFEFSVKLHLFSISVKPFKKIFKITVKVGNLLKILIKKSDKKQI